MCGVAGIWSREPTANAEARLVRMLEAMRHRGPDGEGRVVGPFGAFGMVRLALVDLSDRGQQPIWSHDQKVAILFNGEMYNFRTERERLQRAGYEFRSSSDTEVVLALYLERGNHFVESIRGMFAVAILDWRGAAPESPPKLFLARDRFGIKPLWITGQGKGIAFASELRALVVSEVVSGELDGEGVACYLEHGFVLQPGSILSGVEMLAAGTWVQYEHDRPPLRSQFASLPAPVEVRESFGDAARRLRAILEESVALHALADAPVGAFLSGGIDSSAVVALMRPHVPRLRTYSLGWQDVGAIDETAEAEATAKRFDCEHTTYKVSGQEVADLLPRFAGDIDQPSTDGLNTWFVSRLAAREVKGVLSGLGGDEWFAGYPVAGRMAAYESCVGATSLLGGMGYCAYLLSRGTGESAIQRRLAGLGAYRSPMALWARAHTVFSSEEVGALQGRNCNAPHVGFERFAAAIAKKGRGKPGSGSPLGLAMRLDSEVYMRSQLLRDSDASSMAHSLELRVPLVDVELAGFARTCRSSFKLSRPGAEESVSRRGCAKHVLIAALRDLLPANIERRPKRGFSMPFESWLQGPLFEIAMDATSDSTVKKRGLFEPKAVARTRDAFKKREAGAGYPKLWSLMILELWSRQVLDGKCRSSAAERVQ